MAARTYPSLSGVLIHNDVFLQLWLGYTVQPADLSAGGRLLLGASSPQEQGGGLLRTCSQIEARWQSIHIKVSLMA